WNQEETNASHDAILTALVFSGLVIGRKGLDTIFKPRKVDQEIGDLVIDRILSAIETKPPNKKTVNKTKTTKEVLPESDIILVDPINGLMPQQSIPDPIDWKNLRNKIVTEGLNNPEVFQTSISFCEQMGWNDCVS